MTWDRRLSPRELLSTIDTFDRPGVERLCSDLITHLRAGGPPYPHDGARMILRALRAKRHFVLLQQVADAFVQAGVTDPAVRRQYAQALLDQGALTAAVAVLERLLAEVRGNRHETAEARGLIGRAYKQMYIATAPEATRRRRSFLDRAISAYQEVYREAGLRWHGINVVALLDRARRDGIDLPGDPESLAQEILDAIVERGDDADMWDHGTAMEACIALGDTANALGRLDAYLEAGADAFEIGSTLRQLQEVWGLDAGTEPGAHLIPVLHAALLDRQKGGGDVVVGAAEIGTATLERIEHGLEFEKVLGTERFESLKWFRTALERCRAVALIEDPIEGGVGTGFLVEGKFLHTGLPDVVLVTNAHVVSVDHANALAPDRAQVTFRALDGDARSYRIVSVLWSSPPHELDTTILELDGCPDGASLCPVARRRPLLRTNPPPQTYVIGHPGGGEQVMLSVRDNRLLDADDVRLHYRTPTLGGSSGSPVFNRSWELIALHHSGDTRMAKLNGVDGFYPANEGIWIDRIISELGDDHLASRRLGPDK